MSYILAIIAAFEGVWFDGTVILGYEPGLEKFGDRLLFLVDLPFSFVVDTLLIPLDILKP